MSPFWLEAHEVKDYRQAVDGFPPFLCVIRLVWDVVANCETQPSPRLRGRLRPFSSLGASGGRPARRLLLVRQHLGVGDQSG